MAHRYRSAMLPVAAAAADMHIEHYVICTAHIYYSVRSQRCHQITVNRSCDGKLWQKFVTPHLEFLRWYACACVFDVAAWWKFLFTCAPRQNGSYFSNSIPSESNIHIKLNVKCLFVHHFKFQRSKWYQSRISFARKSHTNCNCTLTIVYC